MKIYFEDKVVEIKARYSFDKKNSKDALRSVLVDAGLAYILAADYEEEQGCKAIAEHMYKVYKTLKETTK